MQLSKLYCNQELFKDIKFNINGLNVIYANVKSKSSEKNNSHDLGKTKLAEIIDFLLLKGIDKNHFLLKIKKDDVSVFEEHVFYLELLLNSGQYLTIKRAVLENTKNSFSISEHSTNGFTAPTSWVKENLTLAKSKDLLSEYLSLDFFKSKLHKYRKAISYSLRRQDDFKDVYRLNKFSKGKDIDWKPFMFDLLGFEGKLLKLKYENDNKVDALKRTITDLKSEYSVKVDERDGIVAEKANAESNFLKIEKQIDHFNFYEKDKNLIQGGIDEIEGKINEFNGLSYRLVYEVEKLKNSIKNNFSFDLNKVQKIFSETKTYFPDELITDYNGLLDFNEKVTTERNKLLKDTIRVKESELGQVNKELSDLNDKREKLLSTLTDSDTFTKFKIYQKDLVKVEGTLQKFQEKLNSIDRIISKEEEIGLLNSKIKDTIERVKTLNQKTEENEKYKAIRGAFNNFYEAIMDENAVLSWKLNSEDNVDFINPKVTSKQQGNWLTAKDEGNTYMKLLCVAFDLAILTTYNKESYYRFVYHDDVLSQQDDGIKSRFLTLIDNILKTNNCQYIISVIKSDLPKNEKEQFQYFDNKDIVLNLHDDGVSGTLFGFEF